LGNLRNRYLLLPSQPLTAESGLIETPLSMRGWRGALRKAFGHKVPFTVTEAGADLWVFEGRVRVSNRQGQLKVRSGEGA